MDLSFLYEEGQTSWEGRVSTKKMYPESLIRGVPRDWKKEQTLQLHDQKFPKERCFHIYTRGVKKIL